MRQPMTMTKFSPHDIIMKEDCILIVIDVQDRLMPVIHDKEKIIGNIIRLLKFSEIVNIPVIFMEQENLGHTVSKIKGEVQSFSPITKIAFNCFLSDEFVDKIQQLGRKTLILTGVETHICVAQTALHALPIFRVHVVSDAVSSRTPDNFNIGIDRLRQSGAIITSTEMVFYELLRKAGTEEFKAAHILLTRQFNM